jgi:hypothetical protein
VVLFDAGKHGHITGTVTHKNGDGSFTIREGGVLGANTRNGTRGMFGGNTHHNIPANKIIRKV